MKNLLFFFFLVFFISACNVKSNDEKNAEQSVKQYLDSLDNGSNNCPIIAYKNLQAKYTEPEDDPNYERYSNIPSKLDSIKRKFSPKIRSWTIYVKFKGKDMYGHYGQHVFLCGIDENLSKCFVAIEIDNISIF